MATGTRKNEVTGKEWFVKAGREKICHVEAQRLYAQVYVLKYIQK